MCKIYAQTDPIPYECRSRSLRISGVTTTIRLENLFWQTLSELAADNDMTTNQLIAEAARRDHATSRRDDELRVVPARDVPALPGFKGQRVAWVS